MSPSSTETTATTSDDGRTIALNAGSQDGYVAQAIHIELQELISQAATIRANIADAKTRTKKQYFQKKFDKISVQVRQMVAALEQINRAKHIEQHPEPSAVEVESVVAENV